LISYSRDQKIAWWLFWFLGDRLTGGISYDFLLNECVEIYIYVPLYNCVTSTLRRLQLSEKRESESSMCRLAEKMWSFFSSGVIICSLKSWLHNIVWLIEQRRDPYAATIDKNSTIQRANIARFFCCIYVPLDHSCKESIVFKIYIY
jgi:hypothetical protein